MFRKCCRMSVSEPYLLMEASRVLSAMHNHFLRILIAALTPLGITVALLIALSCALKRVITQTFVTLPNER